MHVLMTPALDTAIRFRELRRKQLVATFNIQRRTFNFQPPKERSCRKATSIFGVRCWMFDVRLGFLFAALLSIAWLTGCHIGDTTLLESKPPNVVIIFTDDQGYQDVGCFGSPNIKTPNLDRMATQGMRFTDFYVGQAVCSASRAALLTGCYPNRVGILGALSPRSKTGISSNEVTLAEILKESAYATAIYGKWHLGDSPQFLPTRHGFDDYFGLPYSNDMWPKHPTGGTNYPPLPLIQGEAVIQTMPDQTQLTTWYTEHAVKFIEKNKRRPFFLYVPHSMTHVPLFVSDKFRGKTKRGRWLQVIFVYVALDEVEPEEFTELRPDQRLALQDGEEAFRVIHGRDLTAAEKRRVRRRGQ